ncbi:MAG: Gfo/Idh/MocA family oxidoreductase [Bryobacteraceae bacterium]
MPTSRRTFLQTAALAAAAAAPARSANDKVQVGVIGCGARSQEIMKALLAHPQAAITGICDAYKGRLERTITEVGSRNGSKPSPRKDYRDILGDKSIDAVIIATPDHWHARMVIEAVEAGKDVYCEKPLTYRASEGPEIIAAAKRTGKMVQVGSQPISSALQQKAKEIVRSGRLGQITMIRAAYNRNTASGAWIYPIPPDASPETCDWEKFQGSAPKHPFSLERFFRWRCYNDYSGGIATDLFVHLCTSIHFLMDAKVPARAVGLGELYRWKESREVPDTINAVLEYPEGFVANLSATFNNQSGGESGVQVLGTKGSLNIGNTLTLSPEIVREDNQWIVDSWPKALEEAYYKDPKVRETELPSRRPRAVDGTRTFKGDGPDSSITHLGAWLESIRTRQPHWEDASAGHHAAACAHMVNQAARTRRVVEWDFEKDDIRG